MSENYFLDRNRKNLRQLNVVLDELPSFCSIYFVGIASRTTPLTRLNYARDLKIFFVYLTNFEKAFFNKRIQDRSKNIKPYICFNEPIGPLF